MPSVLVGVASLASPFVSLAGVDSLTGVESLDGVDVAGVSSFAGVASLVGVVASFVGVWGAASLVSLTGVPSVVAVVAGAGSSFFSSDCLPNVKRGVVVVGAVAAGVASLVLRSN